MANLNTVEKLTLPQLYCEVNRIVDNGIAGYYVPKKYEDPLKQIQQRSNLLKRKGQKTSKYQTKKGSYLQDQQAIHKQIPGVGKYNLIPPQHKVMKSKSLQNIQKKQTYLDEIFAKGNKEKLPGPSQYQIKEVKSQANINKLCPHDRITYLDQIQYEANQAPGVGNYNPRDRVNTQAISSIWNQKPDYWKKKHNEQQKKEKNKPASPDAGCYDPQLKQLFASKLNGSTIASQTNFMGGKSQRFKTQNNINTGPGKYVQLQQWKGKSSTRNIKYGLDAISKGSTKSVYYH